MAISLESRCHATLNREACQRSVASVDLMKNFIEVYETVRKCCTKVYEVLYEARNEGLARIFYNRYSL